MCKLKYKFRIIGHKRSAYIAYFAYKFASASVLYDQNLSTSYFESFGLRSWYSFRLTICRLMTYLKRIFGRFLYYSGILDELHTEKKGKVLWINLLEDYSASANKKNSQPNATCPVGLYQIFFHCTLHLL